MIFGLPPAEVAVHPSGRNDVREFCLMCYGVGALIAAMEKRGIRSGPAQNLGWGILTHVVLPGGGRLGVDQPRHARPKASKVTHTARRAGARETRRRPKAR